VNQPLCVTVIVLERTLPDFPELALFLEVPVIEVIVARCDKA
jgi:hypothetical protein